MEQLVDGFINELLDRWLDSWSSFPYDCTVQWEMGLILLIYMGFFYQISTYMEQTWFSMMIMGFRLTTYIFLHIGKVRIF